MRIIAGNGYGRFVNLWGNIPPAERESKLYDLAQHDNTDWALCSSCHQKSRDYSIHKEDASSNGDARIYGSDALNNDASDFPALLADLRSKANAQELSPQEKRVLLSMVDYGESIYELFATGGELKDEHGNWEPPLSRSECSDLMSFLMGLIKVGRGDAPIIMDMAISPRSRKYALGFHAPLRLLAEAEDKLVFISPDEKSSSTARQYCRGCHDLKILADERCTFLTWEEAAELPLENTAVVGDAILSTVSDSGRRESIRRCIARVKGKKGVKHFVVMVSKGDEETFTNTTVSASTTAQAPWPSAEVISGSHPGSQSDQRPKSRWGLVLLLLIAVVLAGGFLYWTSQGNSQQQLSEPDAQAALDEGLSFAKARRYPEAAAAFERAIKLRPDFAEAEAQLGLAYQKLGRTQDAIDAAQRAVSLRPGEAWTHRNLGEVYRASEKWTEAIEAYQRATSLKSDDAEAFNAIGFCYRKLKDPQNALDAYSRATSLKSDYVQAHYGRGLAFLDLDDFDSAGNEAEILTSLNRADLAKSLRKFIKPEVPASTISEESTSP
jgi:Tfp pilus assembly protein PilF